MAVLEDGRGPSQRFAVRGDARRASVTWRLISSWTESKKVNVLHVAALRGIQRQQWRLIVSQDLNARWHLITNVCDLGINLYLKGAH